MSEAPQKTYVGSAKEKQGKYGEFISLSFSQKDLDVLNANKNERGYVNLVINRRNQPGTYGETHSVTIDTWKPEYRTTVENTESPKKVAEEIDLSSIPF